MDSGRFKTIKIIMQRAQFNGCPIAAVKTSMYDDMASGKRVFVNEFKNNSDLSVRSFSVKITCFDETGKLIGTIKDYKYNDVVMPAGAEYGNKKLIACPSDVISNLAVTINHVEMADGYFWDESIKKISNHNEAKIVVEDVKAKEESVLSADNSFQKSTYESDNSGTSTYKSTYDSSGEKNEESFNYGESSSVNFFDSSTSPVSSSSAGAATSDYYAESVGSNSSGAPAKTSVSVESVEPSVPVGTVSSTVVSSVLSDVDSTPAPTPVQETIPTPAPTPVQEAIPTPAPTPVQEAIPTPAPTPVQTTSASASAESAAAPVVEENTEVKKKKKMPKVVKGLIAVILIVALGTIAVVAIDKYTKYSDYNRGAVFMASGKYDAAMTIYQRLGTYKDSAALYVEAQKAYANSLYNAAQYEQAIAEFKKIGGQEENISLCYNAMVVKYCDEGHYDEALNVINSADVVFEEAIVQMANYGMAGYLFDAGVYEDAIAYYQNLGDYEDSKVKINEANYKIAMSCMESRNYQAALECFGKTNGYSDTATQILKANYLLGVQCKDSMMFEEAVKYFEISIDYEDSAEQIMICYYQSAENAFLAQNYELAMDYYEKCGEYEDSLDKYNETLYQYLLKAIETDVTEETIVLFEKLPEKYGESADILKTLNKYIKYVGEYEWKSSNDKEINERGGFEEHLFVKLSYVGGEAKLMLDDYPIDLKRLNYKSETNSNTFTILNSSTVTRTFNGKVHTYKKILEE